jgi:hypothetical protein
VVAAGLDQPGDGSGISPASDCSSEEIGSPGLQAIQQRKKFAFVNTVSLLGLSKSFAKVSDNPELAFLVTLHKGTGYGCVRGIAVYLKRVIP